MKIGNKCKADHVELGLSLISSGTCQDGLDLIWAEIESGSDEARVALAYKFGAVGLHVFAWDQWIYLLEQGSTFIQEATFSAFGNAVWMRQYAQAGELLETNAKLKAEYVT